MARNIAAAGLTLLVGALTAVTPRLGAAPVEVDVALVIAVDVSNSVTPRRYDMQMQGIAAALNDPDVRRAMLSGPHKAALLTLVEWSRGSHVTLPWTLISSETAVDGFADDVMYARRGSKGPTCLATMLQFVREKVLRDLPAPATRTIVDVSGDGRDDCTGTPVAEPGKTLPPEPVILARDALIGDGVTINGLPVLEGNEALTLEDWYRSHVIGGRDDLLVPAHGFEDIARAMRLKFVTELLSQR